MTKSNLKVWLINNIFRFILLIGCLTILIYTFVCFITSDLQLNINGFGVIYTLFRIAILSAPIIYSITRIIHEKNTYILFSKIEVISKSLIISVFMVIYFYYSIFPLFIILALS